MKMKIDGFNYEYKGRIIGIVTESNTAFSLRLRPPFKKKTLRVTRDLNKCLKKKSPRVLSFSRGVH